MEVSRLHFSQHRLDRVPYGFVRGVRRLPAGRFDFRCIEPNDGNIPLPAPIATGELENSALGSHQIDCDFRDLTNFNVVVRGDVVELEGFALPVENELNSSDDVSHVDVRL